MLYAAAAASSATGAPAAVSHSVAACSELLTSVHGMRVLQQPGRPLVLYCPTAKGGSTTITALLNNVLSAHSEESLSYLSETQVSGLNEESRRSLCSHHAGFVAFTTVR